VQAGDIAADGGVVDKHIQRPAGETHRKVGDGSRIGDIERLELGSIFETLGWTRSPARDHVPAMLGVLPCQLAA
jgi:hypothetical protein